MPYMLNIQTPTRRYPTQYLPPPGYRNVSPTSPLYNPDGTRAGTMNSMPPGGAGGFDPLYPLGRPTQQVRKPQFSPIPVATGNPTQSPPQSSGADALNLDATNRWYDEYSSAYQAKYGIAPPHKRDTNMEQGIDSNWSFTTAPNKSSIINRWTAVNEPAGIANIDKQITDNARMAAYAQSQRAAQSINAVTNESTPPELKSTMDAIMARYAGLGRYGTSEMYTELDAAKRQYEMSQVNSIANQYSYFNR